MKSIFSIPLFNGKVTKRICENWDLKLIVVSFSHSNSISHSILTTPYLLILLYDRVQPLILL